MSEDEDHSSSSLDSRPSDESPPATPVAKPSHGDDGNDSESEQSHSGSTKPNNSNSKNHSRSGSSSSDGSGSSSDSSDHSEVEDKSDHSEVDDDDGDDGERSRSSRSRSHSRSGSGSASSRSRSGSDGSDSDGGREGGEGDIKKLWQRDPDFYGIRRSSRNRSNSVSNSKPPKLVPQVGSNSKRSSVKKVVTKKRKISSDEDNSSDEEQPRNIRKRGTAVISYKEEESDDDEDIMSQEEEEVPGDQNGEPESEEQCETIERIMDIRTGKKGATGSQTTIYAVEDRGDPNLTQAADAEEEKQFLIKWVGWSHLHNTWESIDTLQEMKAKGLKKLDNYCKKEDDLNRWRSMASPEDIEYYECQLELQQELAKAYTKAERIIAEHKAPDGQAEFYVKWECLSYSEATWENGTLIGKRNPEVIEIFKRREASNRTPAISSKSFKTRPKFVQTMTQPEYMKGDAANLILRDYQLDGVNWLVHSWCKENSVILADEMGLGKTIQTICYLSYLFETYHLYGPYLLVVPLSTMAAWQKEFGQWAPQINVVTYLGDISSRDTIREFEWFFKSSRRIKFNAILTTYEIVLKDKAFLGSLDWAVLMVDEAHRLKNGDSLLYKTLTDFHTNHRLLITGTPLQNSLKELWSLLHFIMPYKFDDWESFEKEHDHAATKGYAKLHKQLEPFILRRVKKDVEKSLPAKVEQILRVDMSSLQKQYYKWILTKNYTALRRGVKGSVSTFVNVVMELKKCCNHAQLVKPIDNPVGDTLNQIIKGSGKLMLLDKLLVRLKETGHRVLIFSQMVRMLDIIAEYLQLRRFSFQRLDGSIKGDLRKQALDHYNAEGSQDFCFLLSTRAGGLGINLATADTVIIFDSDWNPQNDLQAQARAHRIGQKNQVMIYRLVTKKSVEEEIVERAKQKMVLDHLVIQRMDTTGRTVLDKGSKSGNPFNKDELNAILKFGAEELFKEEDNDGEDNCDIDEILRRAETHEEAARPGEELLSAFKVASFSVNEEEEDLVGFTPGSHPDSKDWESIIPEDIRKKVEEEEKEKEMADLYLPPRSSRNANNNENKEAALHNADMNKKARKKRKRDESEESESDGGRPKKRGRPRMYGREAIKGFTDAQIRKFIKSFKKFPNPLTRIETIAKDANLAEKSLIDLKKLGEMIVQRCQSAIADAKLNPVTVKEEPVEKSTPEVDGGTTGVDGKKKPREKGPTFKVAGVMVNAKTMTVALEELEPLGDVIPKDEAGRKTWKFDLKAKTAPYDSEWGSEEDTKLLLGAWEHGMGAWETIRESDPVLKEKIFVEGDKKPQIKHVAARVEHLIKVIKKNLALTQNTTKSKIRKKRVDKKKAVEEGASQPGQTVSTDGTPAAVKEEGNPKEAKSKSKKARKAKNKKDTGPMHYSANAEPTPLNVLGDLEPGIFNECKEKMRPVKKALKALDNPDPTLSEQEQIRHTHSCLLQIGDQIQLCLLTFTDPVQVKQWKSHLWSFVSKFTEYDPKRLYKLYRKAKKAEDGKSNSKVSSGDKEKHKDKEKHHKVKKEKREKEKDSVRNVQESSNSSQSELQQSKSTKSNFRDRDRDRQGTHGFSDNDRVPPANPSDSPFSTSASSSFSPRRYHATNGPSNSAFGGPLGDVNHHYNHSYRDRERDRERAPGDPRDRAMGDQRDRVPGDPRDRLSGDPRDRAPVDLRDRAAGDLRDRAPGDPRDRIGHHIQKNYYHEDRDRCMPRGPPSDRGGSNSGARPWGQSKRWGHYGGPRRDVPGVPPYYGATGPPPAPGAQPMPYPPVPHTQPPLGRIAPPLSQAEWRRSDPKRQHNHAGSKSSSGGSTSTGGGGGRRHDGY